LAAELGGAPPLARGQLFVSSQGWLDFRLRADAPGFLAALVAWTGSHLPQAPGLARLIGARLTVRDTTGKILSGTRDDAAWAQVSAALES
jgi:energy-converting hydrogenase Eha subunit B